MTAIGDLVLAKRIIAGEQEALEELYQRYFTRLYRFAYYQVGEDHEDAQDVLQEALVGALRSLGSYRGDSSLYSWLCGVTWNKAADLRRREWRRRQAEGRTMARLRELRPAEPSSETEAAELAEWRQIERVLATLPAHYRQALEMRYVQGLPVLEMAAELGVSFKTVESRLTRARTAFRAVYQQGA